MNKIKVKMVYNTNIYIVSFIRFYFLKNFNNAEVTNNYRKYKILIIYEKDDKDKILDVLSDLMMSGLFIITDIFNNNSLVRIELEYKMILMSNIKKWFDENCEVI